MMKTLEALAVSQSPPSISGHWSPLRLRLDKVCGDVLNIGVIFRHEGDPQISWRLLSNFSGIRCLYGPDAASNAAFAVDQINSYLRQNGRCPEGWVISSGEEAFASGNSVDEILSRLYTRTVALARHEYSEDERLDSDDHRLSTGRLRRRVRDIIKRKFETRETPEFWRDSPVLLNTNEGKSVALDLQVWSGAGTTSGVMGAITSAWYTSKFHRDAYLSNSYRALVEARQISGGSSKAAMYILRPFKNPRFNEQQIREIDNEIDTVYWSLAQINVGVHVFDNEEAMTTKVLSVC